MDTSALIQPHLRAIDVYNPREDLVRFVRQLGITTVHTGHAPGALVSGQTATFSTTGGTVGEVLRDSITTAADVPVILHPTMMRPGGTSENAVSTTRRPVRVHDTLMYRAR